MNRKMDIDRIAGKLTPEMETRIIAAIRTFKQNISEGYVFEKMVYFRAIKGSDDILLVLHERMTDYTEHMIPDSVYQLFAASGEVYDITHNPSFLNYIQSRTNGKIVMHHKLSSFSGVV